MDAEQEEKLLNAADELDALSTDLAGMARLLSTAAAVETGQPYEMLARFLQDRADRVAAVSSAIFPGRGGALDG